MKIIKRTVLVIAFLGTLFSALLVLLFLTQDFVDYCYPRAWCWDTTKIGSPYLYSLVPVGVLSLITYRMRDAVVRPWLYFTLGWIPLSMALIYITPASRHGDWLNPFVKGFVAFALSVLFVLISVIILARAWWKQRKQAAPKS